jgi:hypothetical protein
MFLFGQTVPCKENVFAGIFNVLPVSWRLASQFMAGSGTRNPASGCLA